MDFSNRLEEILEAYKLTAATLADDIDINRSTISHLLSGRNKPSLDLIMKLHRRFPDVALNWWLYGDGERSPVAHSNADKSKQQVEEEKEESKINELVNKEKPDEIPVPKINLSDSIPSNNSKTVERVILFYTDGTFSTYKPS